MRLPRHGVLLVLAFAALLGRPAPARPATVRVPTLSALTSRAERIVVGEVIEVRCERETVRGEDVPITLVTVRVARTLKGAAASQMVLEFLGGRLDAQSLDVFDLPRFAVGDRDVLFLEPASRSVSPLVGLMHGRFRLVAAEEAPRERVAAHDGRLLTYADLAEDEAGAATRRSASAPIRPVSVATFETKVLELVARGAAAGGAGTAAVLSEGAPLDQRVEPVALSSPVPLAIDVNLGSAPALFDGCPDWSCALASRESFRRLAGPAGTSPASGEAGAERVSMEWGRSVFGRAMNADTLALTLRKTNAKGAEATIVFNDRLAWNSYEGSGRRSPAGDWLVDLPSIASRELSVLAAGVAAGTASSETPTAATSSARGQRRASGVRSSRTSADTGPLDVWASASGCDPGGVFVDPRLLVFDSPDHALMTAYQVGFFLPDAPSPAQTVDVPLTAFLIRRVVDLPSWASLAMQSSLVADIRSAGLATPLGVVYTYRVRGVWAGGTTAWSDSSQPFVRCAAAAVAR